MLLLLCVYFRSFLLLLNGRGGGLVVRKYGFTLVIPDITKLSEIQISKNSCEFGRVSIILGECSSILLWFIFLGERHTICEN